MKTSLNIKALVLEGTPWERGQIHGETMKSMILEGIDLWKNYLQKSTGMKPEVYIDQFVEKTDFLIAIKKWAPHLLEEVKGIGEGAGVDFNTIFAWQCMDEEWWYRIPFVKYTREHCSGLGCFKEEHSPTLLAQNLDVPDFYDGLQVLLHIKHPESSLESFVFTVAGMVGMTGLNNQPLGVCVNTLINLNHSADGLPVAFILRSALEKQNLDKAIEFIHEIKHASGQNYIIGDAEKIVDFECSSNKVCQYIPYREAHIVYHTNHPLVNDDTAPLPEETTRESTTRIRFNYLESQSKDPSKRITIETIKSILSSHEAPVCVHPPPTITLGSLVMSLSTSPKLHLAPGPPCSREYKTFKF